VTCQLVGVLGERFTKLWISLARTPDFEAWICLRLTHFSALVVHKKSFLRLSLYLVAISRGPTMTIRNRTE
jgi:hypothetical protein